MKCTAESLRGDLVLLTDRKGVNSTIEQNKKEVNMRSYGARNIEGNRI